MPETTIRFARKSDIDAMCDLLEQLYSIEADFNFDREKQSRGLDLILQDNSRAQVFVAEHGDRVIAMASLQTVISTAEGGLSAWLEDVVVTAEYRHQGVGTKLLEAMAQWCEQHAISRLQLLAEVHNAPAEEFYLQRQWQPTQLRAWRKILSHS